MATEFLNVDLEVFSREDLAVFARALGRLRNPVIVIAGSGMVISGSADGDHPSERSDDSRRWPADQVRG
jgi:hypothetical protein